MEGSVCLWKLININESNRSHSPAWASTIPEVLWDTSEIINIVDDHIVFLLWWTSCTLLIKTLRPLMKMLLFCSLIEHTYNIKIYIFLLQYMQYHPLWQYGEWRMGKPKVGLYVFPIARLCIQYDVNFIISIPHTYWMHKFFSNGMYILLFLFFTN